MENILYGILGAFIVLWKAIEWLITVQPKITLIILLSLIYGIFYSKLEKYSGELKEAEERIEELKEQLEEEKERVAELEDN